MREREEEKGKKENKKNRKGGKRGRIKKEIAEEESCILLHFYASNSAMH